MQTFLPYADFDKTARVLDFRRLGKQRVEAYQIFRTLTGQSKGWSNHPAVRMWLGYEDCLLLYIHSMCDEWKARGFRDSIQSKIPPRPRVCYVPPWMGDPGLHDSHKSNLLRKDAAFYGQYNWNVPAGLPYVWPIPINNSQ